MPTDPQLEDPAPSTAPGSDADPSAREALVEELRRKYLEGRLEERDLVPADADVTALVEELREPRSRSFGPH